MTSTSIPESLFSGTDAVFSVNNQKVELTLTKSQVTIIYPPMVELVSSTNSIEGITFVWLNAEIIRDIDAISKVRHHLY